MTYDSRRPTDQGKLHCGSFDLAEADNRDHVNEIRFINQGLSESDVERIDRHPEELCPKMNCMNLLYHILFLMKIDGSVGPNEIKLCHEIGLRLGFNYQMVDELIAVMSDHVGQQIPHGILLDIIRKYLN